VSLKWTVGTSNITDLHSINEFKKGWQLRTNLVKDENSDLLAYSHSILNRVAYGQELVGGRGAAANSNEPSVSIKVVKFRNWVTSSFSWKTLLHGVGWSATQQVSFLDSDHQILNLKMWIHVFRTWVCNLLCIFLTLFGILN